VLHGASPSLLLLVEDLRVDVDGVPAVDGLTARASGDRALVLGAPRALFEAASGLRPVARGALRLGGSDAAAAVRAGLVAGVALDPPLPPRWTAREYVTWSARLAGRSAREARAVASEALELAQLGPLAASPLARLPATPRRGVVLAAALATSAPLIALEDPLAGLAEEDARSWAEVLVQALAARRWLVFAGRVPLTSPLATSADEALLVSASRLDAQGPPAAIASQERRFVARIHGAPEALGARLAAEGGRLEVQGAQVLVSLGESLGTSDLLRMATDADVTVVELVSVARALT
jgi:ABC-type multidrug transport system ATPase subunit